MERMRAIVLVVVVMATAVGAFAAPAHAFRTLGDCRWGNSDDALTVVVYRNREQAGPMNARYRAIEEAAIDNYNNAGQGRFRLQPAEDNPAAAVQMEFNSHVYGQDIGWDGAMMPTDGQPWCNDYKNMVPIIYIVLNQSFMDDHMARGEVEYVTSVEHQELGHGMGLDHVAPDEACNEMTSPNYMFFPGQYCEHYGTFLKTDDINGLWYLYPTKKPPTTCVPPNPSRAAVIRPLAAIGLFTRLLAQVPHDIPVIRLCP